jgi:antitoxin HicB
LNQAGITVEDYVRSCDRMELMRTYTIVAEPEPDGGYFVTVPALPGCFTRGSTIEQCRERAVEAIEVHIAGLQADGEPVPEEVGAAQLLAVTVAA